MIINLKYNSQTGLLTPMENYTLAQHNHLADKIVVVSNASNCADYNYCLEFVCYNTKNVPKAQYVSEILSYGDSGIVFDIPNNLTQYAGYVDVQLTGYDKESHNIIFKSISKNSKAFSVEGSLSVLDNALSDTPNILTLLQQELDYVREVKESIANDFENLIKTDLGQVLENFEYSCVEFVFYDKVFCKTYKNNSLITPPILNLSDNERLLGWVNVDSGETWDFSSDRLNGNLTLVANVESVGIVVEQGVVKNYTGDAEDVFVPYCINSVITQSIESTFMESSQKRVLYLPVGLGNLVGLPTRNFDTIVGGKDTIIKDGVLYDTAGERVIGATRLKLLNEDTIFISDGAKEICGKAFFGAKAKNIVLPDSIEKIDENSFGGCTNLSQIVLPANLKAIKSGAFDGCADGLTIVMQSQSVPDATREALKIGSDVYAKIYVPYWKYAIYKNNELWGDLVAPVGDVDLLGKIQGLEQTQQTVQTQLKVLQNFYAVGSLYISVNSTSPAAIFGGTWERIRDRFLLGAGDSYVAGATGGSVSETLEGKHLPNMIAVGVNNSGETQSIFGATWGLYSVLAGNYIISNKSILNNYSNSLTYGQSHNNMPPYLAVYIWRRTA